MFSCKYHGSREYARLKNVMSLIKTESSGLLVINVNKQQRLRWLA